MTAKCVHCGATVGDRVDDQVDVMLSCEYCGHPCCSKCGGIDHSDNDEDGSPIGFYVICEDCPAVHHEECECSICMGRVELGNPV